MDIWAAAEVTRGREGCNLIVSKPDGRETRSTRPGIDWMWKLSSLTGKYLAISQPV